MNADVITIMGSNMAENHPVGFQWVMEARERGADVIHIDPRFTRTSAMSTKFIGIRAGSDIAFLGGVIRHIIENERYFEEYVKTYTNAPVIVDEGYRDTEDLDGLFSGWDPEKGKYDNETWQYAGMDVKASAGSPPKGEQSGHGGHGAKLSHGEPPEEDQTMQHPRCVFQILKRHFARYTPEVVADTCGCSVDEFLWYCEKLCENSGRERTGAFVYAVGWTQHTVGVQYIRTASIIQLLLGNVGRPGGGVMALRGHASIQGSTDIPTLYNILPGYMDMPHVDDAADLESYIEEHQAEGGWWGKLDTYFISLLKAWWGAAATKENDFCFSYLPRIDDDNSNYWTVQQMLQGNVEGYMIVGENPAVGSANGRANRLGLANLKWLVVRDLVEIETASFWYDSEEIESGELQTEEIATEVFFLPAAAHVEKDGSFTNTQRLLQWHFKAVEPKEDCRSELWFYYHLGRKIREKLKESQDPKDRPVLDLTWQYPTSGQIEEPSAEAVIAEIGGWDSAGQALAGYKLLKADGSTSCGCWIYCGVYAEGENQAARRKPHWEQDFTALEWAWAWPMNRRMLYNRAAADPEGEPWSERKRYVWWDAEQKSWTGRDTPDFDEEKAPDYVPPDGASGPDAIRGDHPFIMQVDGQGWIFVPQGIEDGPLPTHYEPHESPFGNPLYAQRANPRRQQFRDLREDPYNPSDGEPGSDVYPYIATTYRLTEHHCAGGFSRFTPYLAELQPAMFVEVHPDLARERRLEHGGWATIVSARSAIEARVMVTDRIRPVRVGGRVHHQVGLPYHWGSRGLTTGGSANELSHLALDPNVHIQEVKAFTCDIRPGRRPRGPALPKFVAEIRERAHATRSAP
jgi:formate dehydrogenase major subunit